MQSVPFSTNGSAHLELRYPGEGLPQLPAVEVFRKRDQLVGIVEHLSVDGTGADHPLFTALFELVAIHTQHLADLAGREEHRAVTLWLNRCSKSSVDCVSMKCVRSSFSKYMDSTR